MKEQKPELAFDAWVSICLVGLGFLAFWSLVCIAAFRPEKERGGEKE